MQQKVLELKNYYKVCVAQNFVNKNVVTQNFVNKKFVTQNFVILNFVTQNFVTPQNFVNKIL